MRTRRPARRWPPGSAVNLVVSTGPAPVQCAERGGLTQAAATTAITAAGLVVGTVTTASSATVPAGTVISESPAAGTSVAAGSAVNLVVSPGPAPVSVPNVVRPDAGGGDERDHGGRVGGRHGDYGVECDGAGRVGHQSDPGGGHVGGCRAAR